MNFCSGIYDSLYFIEQVGKFQTFRLRQFIQSYFTIDTLNNGNFQFRLVGNGTYTQIFGTLYLIFIAVFLDDLYKFFSVTFRLTGPYSGNIL